jgi:hypothetical protein
MKHRKISHRFLCLLLGGLLIVLGACGSNSTSRITTRAGTSSKAMRVSTVITVEPQFMVCHNGQRSDGRSGNVPAIRHVCPDR